MRAHNRRAAAQLRDLHEEVHADAEEEREPSGERVDVEAAALDVAHVLTTVGEREAEFLYRRRARLLHVVAGDRDEIELRHVLCGVRDDVADDPHARLRRIDVRVADHELFEDVVLDGPVQFEEADTLFLARDDVARKHRQHRAVHRQRHGHRVERDPFEQDLHVLDGVDGNAGFPDIADDTRVVAVVSPVGREVERDREPHLPGLEILAEEGVRLLGGREAGVLADGPGSVGVHRRPWAPQERLEARERARRLEALEVGGRVQGLHRDPLGRGPHERPGIGAPQLLRGKFLPVRTLAHRLRDARSCVKAY